ncbi:aldo/keto reductase [Plantactinospora sp. B5E13]|uniref:aldo/keto reductase n=1 Tax=unclassified Plantactinospora TaxID=2631981 RepID=UPI00325F53BB
MADVSATPSGTFQLGGDLPVTRLGFGAMRLTGEGIWGDPRDSDEAVRVLRRAVELGVNFIDTADAYGPFTADLLIHKALHPYPSELVIATKVGFTRQGPGVWTPVGRPEYLRQQVELNLRHLGLDRIDLLQLHRIDPKVPLEDQLGELRALQDEGKIRHVGLSQVSVAEVQAAATITPIVSVQNRYNVTERDDDTLLDHSEQHGIAFIPWGPLGSGPLAREGGPLERIAAAHHATAAQLALAWLLRRSPVMLPIPGTSTVAHLEENVGAAGIDLTDAEFDTLAGAA